MPFAGFATVGQQGQNHQYELIGKLWKNRHHPLSQPILVEPGVARHVDLVGLGQAKSGGLAVARPPHDLRNGVGQCVLLDRRAGRLQWIAIRSKTFLYDYAGCTAREKFRLPSTQFYYVCPSHSCWPG